MVKNLSPDPPFISHYAIIQGEMGLFLTFSVFELQRGYLYQNGVEFRQKVIGAGLNLFWGCGWGFDNNLSVAQKLKKLEKGPFHLEL